MADLGLVKYDTMIRAVAECHDIDEVKDIRDKALALEKYAQVAMNTDAEWQAREIRLRAERKAGTMLADMGLHGGDRKSRSHDTTLKLDDLGISKDQSARWQQLAAVSTDKFETALADPDQKASSSNIIKKVNGTETAMDPDALWLWDRLRDFERRGILGRSSTELVSEMTEAMAADARRLAPAVSSFIRAVGNTSDGK